MKLFTFLYSGNIGTELSSTNLGMFITSDAGNSWRQVRPIWVYALHMFTLNRWWIHIESMQWSCMFLFSPIVHHRRFLMKSTTFGFSTTEGLCWQSYTRWRRFDTCGRCSYSPTIADIVITEGRDCRCWSGSEELTQIYFHFSGWVVRCSIWLHLMFSNGDGPSLHDYCSALRL